LVASTRIAFSKEEVSVELRRLCHRGRQERQLDYRPLPTASRQRRPIRGGYRPGQAGRLSTVAERHTMTSRDRTFGKGASNRSGTNQSNLVNPARSNPARQFAIRCNFHVKRHPYLRLSKRCRKDDYHSRRLVEFVRDVDRAVRRTNRFPLR
jgi:hypothetical protein